jgi:hypothetical protein
MDPGWYARLVGDTNYLDELTEHFTKPALSIFREEGEFYLASTDFADVTASEDARTLATELVAIACGIAEVELGRFRRPTVASMLRVDESGKREHIVHVGPAEVRVRASLSAVVIRADGTRESAPSLPPPPPTNDWADLALREQDVRDALAILGREDVRWHDLYHVFEIVQADVGGQIHSAGWATKSLVGRFTQTANNRIALGREARHGHKNWQAPANPMSLDEVTNFVTGIVRSWLRSKGGGQSSD